MERPFYNAPAQVRIQAMPFCEATYQASKALLVMEFNCKDAEAVLVRVASFVKANNVVFHISY